MPKIPPPAPNAETGPMVSFNSIPSKIGTFVLCLILIFLISASAAGRVRPPAMAGTWYPESEADLRRAIEALTGQTAKSNITIPAGTRLKALVLPHAGISYSGWTAAHAAKVLSPGQFGKVFLLGPDHRIGFKNGAISDVSAYRTPLGLVPLHPDAQKLRNRSDLFQANPASDRNEHSLELVLLFLQYYLQEFKLVPIVLGFHSDIQAIADAIDPLVDNDTLVVISSDLSHFLPYRKALEKDRKTIRMIRNLKSATLLNGENTACGRIPLMVLIDLARRHNWRSVLLNYANSGDTGGDFSRVVGYAAIAFFEGGDMTENNTQYHQFSEAEGNKLVHLARQTIAQHLGLNTDIAERKLQFNEPCYRLRCGTFVTLKENDRLRGCIGNLTADKPVWEGVADNAIKAAFHDPRFAPLRADELDQLDISISILTPPMPLSYSDGDDLISKLRVNVDGVILRKGNASATFLPQVWEQLPTPDLFLSRLCLKAGLSPDDWRTSRLQVFTYQVQYFEENK